MRLKETSFIFSNCLETDCKKFHGYSYNKSVITKLFNSGFTTQLKGGYKNEKKFNIN